MKFYKIKTVGLIGGLCLISMGAFADLPTCTGFPDLNMTCGPGTLPNLNGVIITLNGTTVTGASTVFGKLTLNQGAALQGGLTVGGVLEANDSTIKGPTQIGSTSITLTNTTTSTLNITSEITQPVVNLNSGSIVRGDVNFASNNGIVYERGGSTVTGKVNGGKVVQA